MYIVTMDENRSLLGRIKTGYAMNGRGFSGAIRTEQSETLARLYRKRYILNCFQHYTGTHFVAFTQMVNLQRQWFGG
jgi:hypothetical protein